MSRSTSIGAALVLMGLLTPAAQAASAPGKTPDIFGVWIAIASNSTNYDLDSLFA